MTLRQASWVHGNGITLEAPSWRAIRRGWGTEVRPTLETTSNWVHFAPPTPLIVDGTRLKLDSAMIKFTTGPQAVVTAIHVWDGDNKIFEHNGTNYKGNSVFIRETLANRPEVFLGLGISVQVTFNGNGQDAWATFHSAGVDLY